MTLQLLCEFMVMNSMRGCVLGMVEGRTDALRRAKRAVLQISILCVPPASQSRRALKEQTECAISAVEQRTCIASAVMTTMNGVGCVHGKRDCGARPMMGVRDVSQNVGNRDGRQGITSAIQGVEIFTSEEAPAHAHSENRKMQFGACTCEAWPIFKVYSWRGRGHLPPFSSMKEGEGAVREREESM